MTALPLRIEIRAYCEEIAAITGELDGLVATPAAHAEKLAQLKLKSAAAAVLVAKQRRNAAVHFWT